MENSVILNVYFFKESGKWSYTDNLTIKNPEKWIGKGYDFYCHLEEKLQKYARNGYNVVITDFKTLDYSVPFMLPAKPND